MRNLPLKKLLMSWFHEIFFRWEWISRVFTLCQSIYLNIDQSFQDFCKTKLCIFSFLLLLRWFPFCWGPKLLLWLNQNHIIHSFRHLTLKCFPPEIKNLGYFSVKSISRNFCFHTLRSRWIIGVWQWCSLETALQISQNILMTWSWLNPDSKWSFIICKTVVLWYGIKSNTWKSIKL